MCSGSRCTTSWWLTAAVVAVAVCLEDVVVREGGSESELAMAAYRAAENNGCTAVRFAYGGKGFRYEDVPSSMITGQFMA